MTIRQATRADLDTLLEMGRDLVSESPEFRAIPFSEPELAFALRHSMDCGGLFVCTQTVRAEALVVEASAINDMPLRCTQTVRGEALIVGAIVGLAPSYQFSHIQYAGELALFVRQEWRSSGIGDELMTAFEAWGASKGYPEARVETGTGINQEQTEAFYRRRGYVQCGTMWKKPLPPPHPEGPTR